MKKSLVIVESPSKAKTINKFLGSKYIVKASVGHIKDLPEKKLGIDIESGFIPEYTVIPKQKKVIDDLKKTAKSSENIYIATDPDREGEAIAWHIMEEISGSNKNIFRALFNEITPKAVTTAIENPLTLDNGKIDAQQARRVLDRLVGYQVSPLLWKTLFKGSLSAGRVQSVALMLICDREVEFRAFKKEEYWSIHVLLGTPIKAKLLAKLVKIDGKKAEISDKNSADKIVEDIKDEKFTLFDITKKKVNRNPQPPFITSTIQQEASNKLGYPPAKTMMVAQKLYEGKELGSEGSTSLITYMRTDSFRMSDDALTSMRQLILDKYGKEFLPDKPRTFKPKKKTKIQDAHECIRPTYFDRSPEAVKAYLSPEELKLYTLIWNRTVASQMTNAVFNQTAVKISAGQYDFQANGSEVLFPGFRIVYQETNGNGPENGDEQTVIPPGLKKEMILELGETTPEQHFTKPPPRFTDSSLVKELDQLGIGRPSTYAQIIYTLRMRKYIIREKRTLIPTELGEVVKSIVISQFPDIFDVNFTAQMENELDSVESGSKKYTQVVKDFYTPFHKSLEEALEKTKEIKESIQQKTGTKCEKCGSDMLIKWSRNGKFYACSGFPECKNTAPLENEVKVEVETTGEKCEKCGSDMVVKTGRYGVFHACSGYPKCKNVVNPKKKKQDPPEKAGFDCDLCGKEMLIRSGRRGKFYACSGFPKCKNTKPIKSE